MSNRRALVLALSWFWCCLCARYGQGQAVEGDPAPQIVLLSPVNGEVFSALPVVLSYRIRGVDIVEVYADGTLKWRYEQARDTDLSTTALLMNQAEYGGRLHMSGMHSIILAGRQSGDDIPVVSRRIDFFTDMPAPEAPFAEGADASRVADGRPADGLSEMTGIASVLLIGNFRPPPARDESYCLAGQYKMALNRLGISVHARQEDFSDSVLLVATLEAHKPDLVLYIPELELMHGSSDLTALWSRAEEWGIPTVVMLTDLHNGFATDASDAIWRARYVTSPDPCALSHWPAKQTRDTSSAPFSEDSEPSRAHGKPDTPAHAHVQHIWLPPASSLIDDESVTSPADRRQMHQCWGSLECWFASATASSPLAPLSAADEVPARGRRGPLEGRTEPDDHMYDVLMLAVEARQEHVEGSDAEICGGARHAVGLRRRLAAYFARTYGHRFRHEIVDLRRPSLDQVVARAKITVVVGDCLTAARCPTPGFWGPGAYLALRHGAFVLHNHVAGLDQHLVNGTHLVVFDADVDDLEGSLGRQVRWWLDDSAAAERRSIARRGHEHVAAHHTHQARAEQLLAAVAAGEEALAAPSDGHAEVLRSLAAPAWAAASCTPPPPPADCPLRVQACDQTSDACLGSTSHISEGVGSAGIASSRQEQAGSEDVAEHRWQAVWLDHVVAGAQPAVRVRRVRHSVFPEKDRILSPARCLPGEEGDFVRSGLRHLLFEQRLKGHVPMPMGAPGRNGTQQDEGMQVLAFDNATLSAGGILCNDTHVVTAFSLHGDEADVRNPPGCFGDAPHRHVLLQGALMLPTRWGRSWQHFIQDAAFRLAFALESLPASTHVILEKYSDRNVLAVATVLIGADAPQRLLFIDASCMSNVQWDFRPKARLVCRRYFRARRMFVALSYPGDAMDHQPNAPSLRIVQRKIGAFLLSVAHMQTAGLHIRREADDMPLLCPKTRGLAAALVGRPLRTPSLAEVLRDSGAAARRSWPAAPTPTNGRRAKTLDWLWQCRHTSLWPLQDCFHLVDAHDKDEEGAEAARGGGSQGLGQARAQEQECLAGWTEALILSRGSGQDCKGRHRCLVNEGEVAKAMSLFLRILAVPSRHWRPSLALLGGPDEDGDARRDEVDRQLDDEGYGDRVSIIKAESLPLLQLALAVHSAEIIVAPHGGQCFNLVFARPGTVFVEILPGLKTNDGPYSVRAFAVGLGLRVYMLHVEGVAHRTYDSRNVFAIDPARVVLALTLELDVAALDLVRLVWDTPLPHACACSSSAPSCQCQHGRGDAAGATAALDAAVEVCCCLGAVEPAWHAVVELGFVASMLDVLVLDSGCASDSGSATACLTVALEVNGTLLPTQDSSTAEAARQASASRYLVSRAEAAAVLHGVVRITLPLGLHRLSLVLLSGEGQALRLLPSMASALDVTVCPPDLSGGHKAEGGGEAQQTMESDVRARGQASWQERKDAMEVWRRSRNLGMSIDSPDRPDPAGASLERTRKLATWRAAREQRSEAPRAQFP